MQASLLLRQQHAASVVAQNHRGRPLAAPQDRPSPGASAAMPSSSFGASAKAGIPKQITVVSVSFVFSHGNELAEESTHGRNENDLLHVGLEHSGLRSVRPRNNQSGTIFRGTQQKRPSLSLLGGNLWGSGIFHCPSISSISSKKFFCRHWKSNPCFRRLPEKVPW
mmetsp:Transcript_61264/g.181192  ORF Transcript_61264/g.181192 Transcript_61264/m.181192 type:complete len:166 (+) Transcript_61264:138-635(+)